MLAEGELSRALAAAYPRAAPGGAVEDFRALQGLFPEASTQDHLNLEGTKTGRKDGQPISVDEAVRKRIEEAIPWVIAHHPRKSGSGPADSRFEHWATLNHSRTGVEVCATVQSVHPPARRKEEQKKAKRKERQRDHHLETYGLH